MAALWYHYFLPLLVNSAVLDAHFFYSNAVFGWDIEYLVEPLLIRRFVKAIHTGVCVHVWYVCVHVRRVCVCAHSCSCVHVCVALNYMRLVSQCLFIISADILERNPLQHSMLMLGTMITYTSPWTLLLRETC